MTLFSLAVYALQGLFASRPSKSTLPEKGSANGYRRHSKQATLNQYVFHYKHAV